MTTELFHRESDGSYLISSHRVEMFGLDAIACSCGEHDCVHMETAEVAEAIYKEKQVKEPPQLLYPDTELTNHAGFSFLK